MRLYQIEENQTFNMDDNSAGQLSHQNGGRLAARSDYNQGGGGGGGGGSEEFIRKQTGGDNNNNNGNKDGGDRDGPNQMITPDLLKYSIPGVLHYIQHEWARFELERSQWNVDRSELQAKVAMLMGERKGQESLKSDLIRRIKMLEFALKQERIKFHRLKYGCDPTQQNMNDIKTGVGAGTPAIGTGLNETSIGGGGGVGGIGTGTDMAPDSEVPFSSVSNITWRQGRQLLRQYLHEIGYTDTIIDVRSNRVRLLLGLNNNNNGNGNDQQQQQQDEDTHQMQQYQQQQQQEHQQQQQQLHQQQQLGQRRTPVGLKKQQQTMAEAIMQESESAVLANFEFLSQTEMSDDDEIGDDLDNMVGTNEKDVDMTKVNLLIKDVDAEAEEVINELNLLTEGYSKTDSAATRRALISGGGANTGGITGNNNNNTIGGIGSGGGGSLSTTTTNNDDNDLLLDQTLGLGELAQLTVNNDTERTYDSTTSSSTSSANEPYRKTWNAKYTLRSHFDGVRALAFHPQDPVLITASEDHTLKLWNLQKTVPTKKSASLDVEPLYTFRAHSGPVLCVAMSGNGEQCYSAGLDGPIHCWNLPNLNIDPYDRYDPAVLQQTMDGHCNAVWGLSVNNTKMGGCHLVSCSADGTVKLWSPQQQQQQNKLLLNTYASEAEGIPTSVDFVRDEIDRIIVAYTSAHCIIYDTETGKPVCKLGGAGTLQGGQEQNGVGVGGNTGKFINKVLSHPTLPITVTAHEDRHIRFWDNAAGTLIHTMVAHLEAVTSLAIDSNGLYLLSGSHDSSIRLWNFNNYTCVQEITAHRKKFDESIYDVAFHPTRPFIASAGADALAKVFV